MKIEIRQEHIDSGIIGDEHYCPIALAFEEMFPEYSFCVYDDIVEYQNFYEIDEVDENFEWHQQLIDVRYPDYVCRDLTKEAQEFINKFDNGLDVKPCLLEIWENET